MDVTRTVRGKLLLNAQMRALRQAGLHQAAARYQLVQAQLAAQGKTAPAEFENIAHKLSALGVYVESLQHGHANLDRILHPENTRPSPNRKSKPSPCRSPLRWHRPRTHRPCPI